MADHPLEQRSKLVAREVGAWVEWGFYTSPESLGDLKEGTLEPQQTPQIQWKWTTRSRQIGESIKIEIAQD